MSYLEKHGVPKVALNFINEDHEEAARLTSEINLTITQIYTGESNKGLISPLLDRLLHHKRSHFDKEEASMLEAQFPGFPQHKQEHNRLIHELNSLINHWSLYQDIHSLKTYMNEIFPLWLKTHTVTMDHAVAAFISPNKRNGY
ncbi:hemerythrin family protein [Neptunomonas sp.]|uniref:hemerythrin family protein n=1 Tax=Neptunomonas sp. TaxID=1971898 RepID=UPI0025CD4EC0|nr:hemerythrin family protein [Neptunomonas sp.]